MRKNMKRKLTISCHYFDNGEDFWGDSDDNMDEAIY
jgi:hypothetical protein